MRCESWFVEVLTPPIPGKLMSNISMKDSYTKE
jgi:hypothetical protein